MWITGDKTCIMHKTKHTVLQFCWYTITVESNLDNEFELCPGPHTVLQMVVIISNEFSWIELPLLSTWQIATFFILQGPRYRKSTSIRHFEQCNHQLSNLICQNCDGSIKILLDVANQQHAVCIIYNSFIQIINFHGLFRNALRCRKTGACRILLPKVTVHVKFVNGRFLNIMHAF